MKGNAPGKPQAAEYPLSDPGVTLTSAPARMPLELYSRQKWQMVALSFTALFLELMVIRWVPSVVALVAYYANLMLLSSFLGLGVGALAADRKRDLFGWFPIFLTLAIGTQLLSRSVILGGSGSEMRFFAASPALANAVVLGLVFATNALLFVPLGQRMGVLFNAMPRLSAYGWDLTGSLLGTCVFGWFSLKLFSPVGGLAIVMGIYLVLAPRRRALVAALFAAVLAIVVRSGEPAAIWSPYYHIAVNRLETPFQHEFGPLPGFRTMRNPPIYGVRVNRFGYHYDATFDLSRYDAGTSIGNFVAGMAEQYRLPYDITRGRDRVLVVGAGGGADVEAALLAGAKRVDAVEIDPVIVQVARRFNAGAPYDDPRVTVHIDDARSFLKSATPGYDLVVFGFLDSQALFSSMSNVRLDGYVYTIESLRSAYALLHTKGTMALSFSLGREWLGPKLFRMVAEATGRDPAMYIFGTQMVLVSTKDAGLRLPASLGRYQRALFEGAPRVDLATDDWPFLYLQKKTIPTDYLFVIGGLLAFAVATLVGLRRQHFGRMDLHFGLLGLGFLLLETKSIGDSTLYFGATWLVTLIVVAGVLLMVMAANFVAARIRAFSLWMYAPLVVSLVLLFVVPREQILGLGFTARLLWSLVAVPLPIFFAGIIFSTTFRDTESPSAAFGANLIGAMVGGFCEYLAMAVGSHRLSFLVLAAYLGSLLVVASARRAKG